MLIYSITADWGPDYHIDAATNAITAWSIAHEGTVVLPNHHHLTRPEHQGNIGFFVESPSGTVGQYPPGAALAAAPFYFLSEEPLAVVPVIGTSFPERGSVPVPLPPLWPATAAAILFTALTCGLVGATLTRLTGQTWQAVSGGLFLGLGTGAWSVSSNALWTHGPAMFFIGLAGFLLGRDRQVLAGFAFGGAVLVRPHLAAIAAVAGIFIAIRRSTYRPLWQIGLGSSLGMGALLVFNYMIWQTLTVSGGYGTAFSDIFIAGDWSWFFRNLIGALFDPIRGLVVWAPFLLVLAPAAWLARRRAPDWTLGLALGGLLYLLVQWMSNRFSGGGGFFAYRYPLETLVATAPLLSHGYFCWVKQRTRAIRLLVWTGAAAIAGQGVGAIFL